MSESDETYTFPYQAALAEVDPRLQEAQNAWLAAVDSNTHLDRKTHELIRLVCTCVLRNAEGVQRHAKLAAESGASWEEIVSAMAITSPAFGVLPSAESLPHAREGFEAAGIVEDDE